MKFLENLSVKEVIVIIVLLAVVIGFMFTLSNIPTNLPDEIEIELENKTPWLEQTSKDVAEFMSYKDADFVISSRSSSFFSYYTSPEYSEDKLIRLGQQLERQEWIPINLQQFNNLQDPGLPFTPNQEVNYKTIILCKDNAIALVWVENLQGKYEHTKEISTFIMIELNYLSPCYGLET